MRKLKISIPKLHCKSKTDWFSKDEVYLALIVISGKDITPPENINELNEMIVHTGVSPINEGFNSGTIKGLNLGNGEGEPINIELEDDVAAIGLAFGLYEKDNANIYEELMNSFRSLLDPNNPTFSSILQLILAHIRGDSVNDWLKSLIKFAVALFREIRKDDLIGMRSIQWDVNPAGFDGEFQNLQGVGGKYHIRLKMEIE